MIPFTRRELRKAFKGAGLLSKAPRRSNAHRLLLFYAVECGLKAAYMKQSNIEIFDKDTTNPIKHDLNKLMIMLRMNSDYLLANRITLCEIRRDPKEMLTRECKCGEINQIWRYGGIAMNPTDEELEFKLEKIYAWVEKELNL